MFAGILNSTEAIYRDKAVATSLEITYRLDVCP